MPQSPTRSSTPRLSELARHVVIPSGIVTTGWPSVEAKCADLGIGFDSWQHGAGRIMLGKRADGKYAAGIGGIVLSIPRQVGKTYMIGAIVFALCLLTPNVTVIWTAHRLRTANETFKSMRAMAKRKKIAPFVDRVVLGSGEEEIVFQNGSRILFGARERGFGVGFAQVDVLVVDEAQRATTAALDDMVPTTNQSRQPAGPLLFFMGTPPRPTDPGEVFQQKRDEALSGEDEDTAYIEFSADPDADPDDWAQVAKANPSYPRRTPREAILRMRKNLGTESFLREGFGIWDAKAKVAIMPRWPDRIADQDPSTPAALGIAVSIDRAWTSIAPVSADEVPILGATRRDRGVDWVVTEALRIQTKHEIPVVIAGRGPGASLIKPLEEAGVRLIVADLNDYQDACAGVFDSIESGAIEHGDYDDLNDAVDAARWTPGDRRVFTRKGGDVSMLEAATLALWGSKQGEDESIYEDRGLVSL